MKKSLLFASLVALAGSLSAYDLIIENKLPAVAYYLIEYGSGSPDKGYLAPVGQEGSSDTVLTHGSCVNKVAAKNNDTGAWADDWKGFDLCKSTKFSIQRAANGGVEIKRIYDF